MHGYSLHIRRKNQTDTLFYYHGHEHGTTAVINQKWPNSVTQTDLELEVKAILDHDGNIETKKVNLRAN